MRDVDIMIERVPHDTVELIDKAVREIKRLRSESETLRAEHRETSARLLWLQSQVQILRSEIDGRIEHGAYSGGHLEEVRAMIDKIQKGPR